MLQRHLLGIGAELPQGIGKVERIAAELRAAGVSQVFPGSRNGQLDDGSGNGGQHGQEQPHERIRAVAFFIPGAAENGSELQEVGKGGDGRSHDAGNGLDENVAVGDVGHFVGQHAFDFVGLQNLKQTVRDSDHGVLGIAARGKGIGSLFGNGADARLGHAGVPGQFLHNLMQHGGFFRGQFAGIIRPEHDLIGIPVAAHVHDQGEDKGENNAAAAADKAAYGNDDGGKQNEKEKRFKLTRHISLDG